MNNIEEILTEVLASKRSSADKDRAAAALKFFTAKVAEGVGRPEVDQHVARVFAKMGAEMLWQTPEDCFIETRAWSDGITRTSVLSKKFHGPKAFGTSCESTTPTPTPVPEFTPALPLPVMQVSDVEQTAVKESASLWDERFSEQAVAARIAAIEKEAAAMRAAREQS